MNDSKRHLIQKAMMRPTYILTFFLVLGLFTACDEQATSIWNPEEQASGTAPTLTSITPEGGYLSGVDAITVTGTGFSPNLADNKIYFSSSEDKGVAGVILSGSSTQLEVRPPNIAGDTILVKALVTGSETFSNTLIYKLSPPIVEVYPGFVPNSQTPVSLGLDNNGDLFVAITESGTPLGVNKVDVSVTGEEVSNFILANNRFRFDAIDFSSDNRMYICLGIRAVFQGTQGEKEGTHFIMPNPFTFMNFDMDENGNMWLVGNNTHIVRHVPQTERVNISNINSLPDNTVIFPFEADVRGVSYYNSALYLVGKDEAGPKIWKASLNGNSEVTSVDEFTDLGTALGDVGPDDTFSDMVIAEDGMLYVATNRTESILEISADGSTVGALYEGVLYPSVTSLDWDNGDFLYANTIQTTVEGSINSVIKINMQKKSAPDF
jgi:hypothetical protein